MLSLFSKSPNGVERLESFKTVLRSHWSCSLVLATFQFSAMTGARHAQRIMSQIAFIAHRQLFASSTVESLGSGVFCTQEKHLHVNAGKRRDASMLQHSRLHSTLEAVQDKVNMDRHAVSLHLFNRTGQWGRCLGLANLWTLNLDWVHVM